MPQNPTTLAVMQRLQQGDRCSGTALAGHLGLSRAAVHKAVASLRRRGFVITGSAGAGYLLTSVPDLLCQEAVVPMLQPQSLGAAGWEHHDSLPSTNTRAVEWARAGAPHGAVVVAESQSGGRGRRGRSFQSPHGVGIYLSVILRPSLQVTQAHRLTLCAGHAVVDVCSALGVDAGLKWPNDVWSGGRKLCGVLTELAADSERIHHAVVGIGLNVNTGSQDLTEELRPVATSLALELGRPVQRVKVCAALLDALTTWYHASLNDFPAVLLRARQRSITLGRRVRIRDGHVEVVGDALDLDEDGALVVRTAHGVQRVVGGDVDPQP